jgi:hypothetical protein
MATLQQNPPRHWPSDVLLLAGIAAVGCVNLIYPFLGDQALFVVGARMISNGAVLYRDFWDLKQPGIYLFYLIAGRLFGFNEIGIHVFEIAYFTCFAAVICAAMRMYYQSTRTVYLAVLLSIGVYFAICGPWHLTQAEGLVTFPLFLCLVFARPRSETRSIAWHRYFGFGAAAAVVVLFKLVLVVIPAAFFAGALWVWIFRYKQSSKEALVRAVLPAVVGGSVVLAPFALYFAAEHQLGLLYQTFIQLPPRIVSEVPLNGVRVLRQGLEWFIPAILPLIPFAIVGAVHKLRAGWDFITAGLVGWVVLGCAIILGQRMWWAYHFVLLIVPMGLLAALGFEQMQIWLGEKLDSNQRRRVLRIALLAILLGPYVLRWSFKAIAEVRGGLPISDLRQQAFRKKLSPSYASASVEVQALGTSAVGINEIYVIGDPLIYYLAGKSQALSLNGWSPEWLLHEQWDQLASQLETKRPRCLFVADEYRQLLQGRGQAVGSVISLRYTKLCESGDGAWYLSR